MSKIVGIDFGTTNVRIAQWDADSGENPSTCPIGQRGLASVMPTVMAFKRQPDGRVDIVVGEDADDLDLGPDTPDDTRIIRNIKRWALASDDYVRRQIEWDFHQRANKSPNREMWPAWLDLDSRTIRLWNDTVSLEEAVARILKEAISRSGLAGAAAEWRAGCPVSSDLVYRKALVSALEELGCSGKIEWITEEPLLFVALGDAIGTLEDGSYLVYDIGGGSFDCAIVEKANDKLTVYAEESLPALGGMDIDEMLTERLEYSGSPRDLRINKESLSSESSESEEIELDDGRTLSMRDIERVLEEGKFIQKTLLASLDAYKKAKLLWKRPDGSPPHGEILLNGKSVWSLKIEDMARDLDQVLVVGGPTLTPYFPEKLREVFGSEKVITAAKLAGRLGIDSTDAALTTLSHGACYMYDKKHMPITVDRVPANITLKVTDANSTREDRYEAFTRLPFRRPLDPHEGQWLDLERGGAKRYSIQITSPDGDVLESKSDDLRMPRDGYQGPQADRVRFIVDRFGSVWMEFGAGFTHIHKPMNDVDPIVQYPVWQTDAQRETIELRHEKQRKFEERQAEILHRNLTHNPFGHGERPG